MKFRAEKTSQNWFKIHNIEAVHNFLTSLPVGQPLDVDIDKPKERRNLSQNALLHALFMELDKLLVNGDKDKTKWQVLIEVGFYEEFEINGRLEKLPKSTSKLEKKPFSELVRSIIEWAWNFHQWDIRPESQKCY